MYTMMPAMTAIAMSINTAKIGERAYDKETGRLAQVGLHQQIAMLPTPNGTISGPDYARADREKSGGDDLQTGMAITGMKLQPAFVVWMMGVPIGWTDLNV